MRRFGPFLAFELLFALLALAVLLYVAAQTDASLPATSEALRQPVYPGRGIAAPSLVPGAPLRMAAPPSGTPGTNGMRPASSESRAAAVHPARLPDTATDVAGTATWCAPTPRYCHGWGGTAHLGAMASFRYGDRPYLVTVRRGSAKTIVRVVSYCDCGSTLIDLSPAAFRDLAPLSRGRIRVTLTVGVALPATDMKEGASE
jgi:hypothetical protein